MRNSQAKSGGVLGEETFCASFLLYEKCYNLAVGHNKGIMQTSSFYHLLDRTVGWFAVAAATFTLVGAGEFVTMTALTYWYGYAMLFLFIGLFVPGLIFSGLAAKKFRSLAEKYDWHSIHDALHTFHGKPASVVGMALLVLMLGGALVNQYVVGGLILSSLLHIPYEAIVIGMAALVTGYISYFGFKGVLASDKLQAIAIVGITAILSYVFFVQPGKSVSFGELPSFFSAPLADYFTFALIGFFGAFGGGDIWQRLFAARDGRAALWGATGAAGLWLLFGFFFLFFAVVIQGELPNFDPNTAFIDFVSGMSGWLGAIVATLVFIAVVSTADIQMFVLSVILGKEFKRTDGTELPIKRTRILVPLVAVASGIVSVFFSNVAVIYLSFL